MVAYDAVTIGCRVLWFVAAVAKPSSEVRAAAAPGQGDGLFDVEPFRDETRTDAHLLAQPDLVEQLAGRFGLSGERVEAELGQDGHAAVDSARSFANRREQRAVGHVDDVLGEVVL